jgi:voltage-gated potassium channel
MLIQLVLASAMVVVTVLVHLTGLAILMRVLRSHSRLFSALRIMPLTLLLAAAIGIFAIHTAEIWSYAALYLSLGAFREFEVSLYFSTVTYASIGYGGSSARSKARPGSSCSAGRRLSLSPCSRV